MNRKAMLNWLTAQQDMLIQKCDDILLRVGFNQNDAQAERYWRGQSSAYAVLISKIENGEFDTEPE